MVGVPSRWPAAVALFASLLGFVFSGYSTLDYVKHLDRQVHDIHCSFIPGAGLEPAADNACRVAMYSPYSAFFRDRYWGGVPISLFAMGAFAFFIAFALYLLLAGERAPRRAAQFLGFAALTPLLASVVMAIISATKLGQFCKTCVGIYGASLLLAGAGIAALVLDRREARAQMLRPAVVPAVVKADGQVPPTIVDGELPDARAAASDVRQIVTREETTTRRTGGILLIPSWLLALGLFAATPGLLYASALPSYTSYISGCGKLQKPTEPNGALLKIGPPGATQPATLFVDPLCPTCKGFHQRLVAEGYFDQLDTTLVLFPLDSECNWMLDRPVHPGACLISKAVICGEHRALQVLEWAYDQQETLLEWAKMGPGGLASVRRSLRERWPELDVCIDAKDTKLRLDRMLRYIVTNQLQVSTPQLFVGDTRLCDEDSDIGLPYTLGKLAPGLRGNASSRPATGARP